MENDTYDIPEAEYCLGYSNLGCIEIRIESMENFIEKVKELRPNKIWSCYAPICNKFVTSDSKITDSEKDDAERNIFFFVKDNTIYSSESEGFEKIKDFLDAVKEGFGSVDCYRFISKIREKYTINSCADVYREAKSLGYSTMKEFDNYYDFFEEMQPKNSVADSFSNGRALGYRKIADFENGKARGFRNGQDYYAALGLGIKFACDFDDFTFLTENCNRWGFSMPYEFHIFHIINRLGGGQGIPLREILSTWVKESFYYDDEWYSIKKEDRSEERLEMILSTNKKFSELGKIENEPKEFVLYRNDIIYVDGSNVAWNNRSKKKGDIPHAENIKIVVKALKKEGFTNVVALCDSNLQYDIDDPEIYGVLVKDKILFPVRGNTVADEWIVKFKGSKDLFIITNDAYKQYRNEYRDLGSHLVRFQVAGKEAVFYGNIKNITDRPNKTDELPNLCRQNH